MMSMMSADSMSSISQKEKEWTSTTDSTEIGDGSSVEWLSMADAPEPCEVPQPALNTVKYGSKIDTVHLDDEAEEASCTANFFKSVSYAEPFVPLQPPPGLGQQSEIGMSRRTSLGHAEPFVPLQPPPGLGGALGGDLQAPLADLLAGLAQPIQNPHDLYFPDFQTQCMLAAHSLEMRAALCRSTLKHMDDLAVRNSVKPEKKQKPSKSSSDKTVKLKNQATLDFRAQKLRSLPEQLGQLDQVTTLILSRNKLASLPSNIGHMQNLQLLNLSHNFELTSLPEGFGQLRSLQTLLLHDNKLSKLPENFGELESLQLLYLQSNKLTCLPESFSKLKALQILDLRRNVLTSLPEDFGSLTRLQTLSLQYNRLSSLPKTFSNLINLQELNLWSNPIPRSALPEVIGEIRELQPLKYGHPGSA